MSGVNILDTEQSNSSPVSLRGVVRWLMTIRGLMVRWLRLVDGLVDRLLGLMLLRWLNVGVRRLSLVGGLRSVNREVSRWTVNTQPWLGSSDLGLGLRSPELNIWGFVLLTEGRASILG